MAVGLQTSVQFGVNKFTARKLKENYDVEKYGIILSLISGVAAGLATSFISTVAEHIRIRM